MDQIKIGKFISERRKEKELTQKQLADKLMLSDKTISKWECGNGLPEVSLMLPLCDILNISVNELLTGEILNDQDYKMKAEENIVTIMKERADNKQKIKIAILSGFLSTLTFLAILLVVVFYAKEIPTSAKVILSIIACFIFTVGLFITLTLDRKAGYYECKCCHETFVPTWAEYVFAFHTGLKRHLKCPKCGKKSLCKRKLNR